MEQLKLFPEINFEAEKRAVLAELLHGMFGDKVWDDSLEETARRILTYWKEYVPQDELPFAFTTFPTKVNQMIVVKDIEFSSICAHHLLPFIGVCHVAYLPNKLMVGVSKIPRLVDFWAKRPSVQEVLTSNIASDMKHRLEAQGVAVIVVAKHTCMACRGVRKHNGEMVTSEARGVFLSNPRAQEEFMRLIGM